MTTPQLLTDRDAEKIRIAADLLEQRGIHSPKLVEQLRKIAKKLEQLAAPGGGK